MTKQHVVAALCVAVFLAGCGGGGGGGKGQSGAPAPAPPVPAPTATVAVTVSSPPVSQTIDYGDDFSTTLDGTWSGSNLGTGAVYLQVTDSGSTFSMPPVQAAPANIAFHYALNAIANVGAGDRTGTLTVNACKDQACSQVYSNASASVTYRLSVGAVGEWETLQRDATHNAYVPIRVDPARFTKAWEWTFPREAAAADAYVLRPATGPGALYLVGGNIAADDSSYGVSAFSLDENTGSVKWTSRLAETSVAAPAAVGGLMYIPTPFSSAHLTVLDTSNGNLRFRYTQTVSPSSPFLAPTLFAGTAYFVAGANSSEMHAANAMTGAQRWARPRVGSVPTTPAVDQAFVYYFGGHALNIVDRLTGDPVASLPDPSSADPEQPTTTVPVLGSRGNVIVNSYNSMGSGSYRLTSFNVASRQLEWSTQNSYRTLFAAAPGVVYATRRGGVSAAVIDAIDEATGKVVGTWSPPPADGQEYAANNIIATRNLVFVTTATSSGTGPGHLYAIDRATMQTVWSYPEGGYCVISANRTLYLMAGDPSVPSERIVAFKLR
jgi:outer membrane protein assembly factor BamB